MLIDQDSFLVRAHSHSDMPEQSTSTDFTDRSDRSSPIDAQETKRIRQRPNRRRDFFLFGFIMAVVMANGQFTDALPTTTGLSATTESTLDVLRDQPGKSPADINERARRCSNTTQLSCTSDELEAVSVCGSDGRTYSSVCEIKKIACHGNPVRVIDKSGPCSAKQKCGLERAFQKEIVRRRNQSDLVIPECEPDGSYSPVQCHKETGFCWCVTNTGRPIPNTSVRFKRPDCMPQGKVGRRSSRRRLGMRRRGCSTADRSTFSMNLMKIFRAEYEKDTRNRQSPADEESTTAGVVASKTKQVIEWKFEKLDINGDRGISPRESIELRRMIRDRVQPKACARRFAKYCDLDGNKKITRSEWSVCLGVDINMSLRLFQSLNTSDEMQRQEFHQRQQEQQQQGSDVDVDDDQDDYGAENFNETTTTVEPKWEARNRQRNGGGGGRRRGANVQRSNQNQFQQNQRRHASSRLHSGSSGDLIEASRRAASSASSAGGLSFLTPSDKMQKPEKDEIEEPNDCQSQRRRAQEQHQLNPDSGVYIPNCQTAPDGRLFERVQCHDQAGFCWCADPETGKPIPGTPRRSEKPDCSVPTQTTKPGIQGIDGEIKGCTPKKRNDFLKRLHATLISSMIASGHSDTEDMTRSERALRWKFDELDKNKNKILERKEWKPYRLELKTWKGMRKCGRNFLRSCDANGDKRITLNEWLNCAGNTFRGVIPTLKPNNRRGPNPFVNILDPHQ